MARCPRCGSDRVMVLLAEVRRGTCTRCRTQWLADVSRHPAVVVPLRRGSDEGPRPV